MADILNGTFVIEVLGGNHTRQALTELQYSENVPVVIYAGLTNDQALYLGYEHNRIHHNNRVMTFEEDVMIFRKTGTVNLLSKHINLCHHKEDFGIDAEPNFFCYLPRKECM